MLSFIYLNRANQIQDIIEQYPTEKYRWIVSDLKSKQDLQTRSLQKNNFYQDSNILRISDFWGLWLRRLAPQIQVLSSDFIKIYIRKLSETDPLIKIEPHQVSILYYYIQQLAPLILSGNHESLMEWFSDNKYNTAEHKWYTWYLKAKYTLEKIIENQILEPAWISSYLQRLNLQKMNEAQPIVLDLATQMTSVEIGLFNRLSKNCDVYVLVPNPEWHARYQFLLNTYKTNEGFAKKIISDVKYEKKQFNPQQFLRLSTQLAEVKWITQTVRAWLDSGVLAKNIALLSPQAEMYWPTLSKHLETEGVPVDKNLVTSLISTGYFQNLISQIQSFTSDLSWEDLEVSYFQNETNLASKNSEFERFKALFCELTESEDLGRDQEIKKIFYRKINLQNQLNQNEFLAEILKIVVQQKNIYEIDIAKNLEIIFKDMLVKTADLSFKFTDWFEIFKTLLSKKEIKIKNGQPEGLQIRDLGAVYLNTVTHRIWFGLDDSVFQNKSKNIIPIKDIEILKNVFDYPLQYPEESHDDFNLRWLSESDCTQQYFTCAHVSLMAEPLNSALFILENNIKPDYLFVPETRLDQIQNQYKNDDNKKLNNEMQTDSYKNSVTSFKPTEVSGTDVANYAQCEFKLLASRGFRLRDYSVVSVDLDPMQRGTLAHDLFQYLMTDDLYKSVSDLQITDFLEEKRIKQKLFPNDDLFWALQKNKFLLTAKRFCTHEVKRLQGRAFTHSLEKEFSINIDDITINGRIDRIDLDVSSGESLIYDYKRSGSASMSSHKNWLSKKEYQMLFYLLAVIEQTANAEQVRGAIYYFYQKLETNKGIIKMGNEKFEAVVNPTKSMSLNSDDFNQLISDFKTILSDIFVKLKKSEFSANPYDKSICTDCDWRRLCRAPHLN